MSGKSADCRTNVVEARSKLETLKALENDDPDRAMRIFIAEVEVAMLGGDPEKVLFLRRFETDPPGTHDGSGENSKDERVRRRYDGQTLSHASQRSSPRCTRSACKNNLDATSVR